MKRRTWVYVLKPQTFEMTCDRCGGSNIVWSEYVHKVYCFDCKDDVDGTPGIFGGPIPLEISALLGITFERYNIKKDRIEYPRIVGKKIKYFASKKDK